MYAIVIVRIHILLVILQKHDCDKKLIIQRSNIHSKTI